MTDEEHKETFGSELDMHHIVRARTFDDDYEAMNQLTNLATMCNVCHKKYEHLPNEVAKKLIGSE